MNIKTILFMLVIVFVTLICFPGGVRYALAENPSENIMGIELEGRYWMPSLSSTINMGNGIVGTDINVISDLGIDESQQFFQGKVNLKLLKRHNLRFSYVPVSMDASNVIGRTFTFRGKEYAVNTRVNSSLDIDFVKIGYGFDVISNPMGSLGLFLDIMYADVSAKISAPDLGISATGSVSGYAPAIGVRGRVYIIPNKLSLTAEVEGAKLSDIARYLEAEGSVDYSIIENLGLSVGYKTIDIRAEKDDNKGELKLNGPYLSLLFRF